MMGTFLGVPITRTIIFWGLYWGPPFSGNYHVGLMQVHSLRVCFSHSYARIIRL